MGERACPKLIRVIGYASVHRSLFPSIEKLNSFWFSNFWFEEPFWDNWFRFGHRLGRIRKPAIGVQKRSRFKSSGECHLLGRVPSYITLFIISYKYLYTADKMRKKFTIQTKTCGSQVVMIVKMSFCEIKASVSERPSEWMRKIFWRLRDFTRFK